MALRILVVDDDDAIRASMSMLLSAIGYTVRLAEDGLSALRQIREELPDILLSDLNMPEMSGFELLAVVRHQYPAIPVIAMSGAFPGGEIPDGVAADAFHRKGSSIDALLEALETLAPMEGRTPGRLDWQPAAGFSVGSMVTSEEVA